MKGDKKVIGYLNQILGNELVAINQYFLHARIFDHWGLTKLGTKTYEESIDEMKHADELIKRILFLGGLPNMQDYNKVSIGESVKEALQLDLKTEIHAIAVLQEAIAHCETVKDFGSRDLLNGILTSEEEHMDWLETQIELMDRIGEQNYQQSHV